MTISQKGEKGIVKPFARFLAEYDAHGKRKEHFTVTSSKNLIFAIVFEKKSESCLLGEREIVRKVIENVELSGKDSKDLLIYQPDRAVGSFLMDSYAFIDSGAFLADSQRLLDLVRGNNENTKYSVGKKDEVSTVNTLQERFHSDNLAEKIFLDYYYFMYCKERRDIFNNQGLSLKKGELIRKERYERLVETLEDDFRIIGSNITSQKDLRELKIKDRSAATYSTDRTVLLCENWQQMYAGYINYLASCKMFFKKCKNCHKLFYASNYRTQMDEKCIAASDRENKKRSFEKQLENNIEDDFEMNYRKLKNFMRSKKFENAPDDLKNEAFELHREILSKRRAYRQKYRKKINSGYVTIIELATIDKESKSDNKRIREDIKNLIDEINKLQN